MTINQTTSFFFRFFFKGLFNLSYIEKYPETFVELYVTLLSNSELLSIVFRLKLYV